MNCGKDSDVQGIFKIKYNEVIKGWNFDHYDEKEGWELMKNIDPKKVSFIESKNNNLISLKIENKDILGQKNEMLSKKTHAFKKNTQFIYKSLFNEIERESAYPNSNFFSTEMKNELNVNLIEIDKNYIIPLLIQKLHPHLKGKEYNLLRKNPGFLEKIALVCEDCYLLIIGSSHSNETLKQITKKNILKNGDLVGQGKLNPEQLVYRFNV